MLADLGDLAAVLLALDQATGDLRWMTEDTGVIDHAVRHFADRNAAFGVGSAGGDQGAAGSLTVVGFFDSADDAGTLILRPRHLTDGAAPSGLSSITHPLLSAAALTGNATYRTLAG